MVLIRFADKPSRGQAVSCVVVGKKGKAPDSVPAPLPEAIKAALKAKGGKLDDFQTHTILVPHGVDEPKIYCVAGHLKDDAACLPFRQAGVSLAHHVYSDANKSKNADLALNIYGLETAAQAVEFALGIQLGHAFGHSYPKVEKLQGPRRITIVCPAGDHALAQKAFERRVPASEGVRLARRLTAMPGNVLTPGAFAAHMRRLQREGLEIEVIEGTALKPYGLISAVGAGSANAPRIVALKWACGSAEEKAAPPTVLIGKGITFDTGGICLKPASGMPEMITDMGGAAAVAGTMLALARAQFKGHVIGLLAIAENMPSGKSYRPGDVLTAYNGTTVEVIDTDAEGRLVLADALAHAAKHLQPARVIDLATLTGSIVVTLGSNNAGLFANDDALAMQIEQAGAANGEGFWRMPLCEDADDALKSDVADWKNCTEGRLQPDALHAARFLQKFIPENTPWAHLDIAGMIEGNGKTKLAPKGYRGFAVQTLFDVCMAGQVAD